MRDAEGPIPQVCPRCRLPGRLVIEARQEWADPPPGGWPAGVAAVRLAQACRRCGADYLTLTQQLAVVPGGGLAQVPWLTCALCDHGEAACRRPWLTCGRCGYEAPADSGPG